MPAQQQHEQHAKRESREDREKRNAVIGKQVLHALGVPAGPHRVQVRPLWGDYCRVNVFIGEDLGSARVANSYFLEADGEGNIVQSTPAITRHY